MLVAAAALDWGDVSLAAEAEAERALEKVQQQGATLAAAWKQHLALLSGCIRDLFGYPGCPLPQPSAHVLAWNDRLVPRICAAIYEERGVPFGTLDNARLAILADALLDAGCEDEHLIHHCRSRGSHFRGCWAIDLLLGKDQP
jgi:hypothetical protein